MSNLVLQYSRRWDTMEETVTAYLQGTGKVIEVLLSNTASPSHPTSIKSFLDQFTLVHHDTFMWLLEHAQPTPRHEMPTRITIQQLFATTQYLKGDQNV